VAEPVTEIPAEVVEEPAEAEVCECVTEETSAEEKVEDETAEAEMLNGEVNADA
jgi:hypothetical protein